MDARVDRLPPNVILQGNFTPPREGLALRLAPAWLRFGSHGEWVAP